MYLSRPSEELDDGADQNREPTRTDRGTRVARWLRPVLLVAVVAVAVAVALTVGVPPIGQVRAWVGAAGWAGPALYAALYAALSLTPVPATVLSVGGGVLFGLVVGVPVVVAGALTGAGAGFALARYLGRSTAEDLGGARLVRLDALLRRHGLPAMIGIRLVPIVPFAILNAACGLTAVRARDYLLGTALGMLPGVIAFAAIGAYGSEPTSVPFLLAVGGLMVLLGGGAVVARRRRVADRAA